MRNIIQVIRKRSILAAEGKAKKSFRKNPLLEHVPSDETDLEISEINSQNLTWKANVCMLQKTHKDYGSHCQKSEATSLAQTGSGVEAFTQVGLDAELLSFE